MEAPPPDCKKVEVAPRLRRIAVGVIDGAVGAGVRRAQGRARAAGGKSGAAAVHLARVAAFGLEVAAARGESPGHRVAGVRKVDAGTGEPRGLRAVALGVALGKAPKGVARKAVKGRPEADEPEGGSGEPAPAPARRVGPGARIGRVVIAKGISVALGPLRRRASGDVVVVRRGDGPDRRGS